MTSIKQLTANEKTAFKAYCEALAVWQAAEKELKAAKDKNLADKMAKCEHSNTVAGSKRVFEGKGFYDVEFEKCANCGRVMKSSINNVVLDSGSLR